MAGGRRRARPRPGLPGRAVVDRRADRARPTAACRGFVYAASMMGVTGTRATVGDAARDAGRPHPGGRDRPAGRASASACSDGAQAAEVAAFADGVIVGSAFVRGCWSGRGLDGRARPRREDLAEGSALDDSCAVDPQPRRRASGTSARCPIRAYALCIIAGIVAAVWLERDALGRPRRRGRATSLDIAVWAVPFGIVGGRLYHVITAHEPYFGAGGHPLRRLRDLGGRPRHLGRDRPRRRRRLDRLPAPRHPAAAVRRRAGARARWSPRPSAGWATGSTRSCSAGRRRCRGA